MLFINPIAKALDDTNDYKAEILDKTNKIHAKHIKNITFDKEKYYKKRLFNIHNSNRDESKRLPKHVFASRIKECFSSYEDAFTVTLEMLRKKQQENDRIIKKLDMYESIINNRIVLHHERNDQIKELITLQEQPSILDELHLYEKPDIDALNKLIKSDLLEAYEDFSYNNELQHLEAYRNSIDEDGEVEVKYI